MRRHSCMGVMRYSHHSQKCIDRGSKLQDGIPAPTKEQLLMMGPIEGDVVWKPSCIDVMSWTLPSAPGTGEGARLLFLQLGHCEVEPTRQSLCSAQERPVTPQLILRDSTHFATGRAHTFNRTRWDYSASCILLLQGHMQPKH